MAFSVQIVEVHGWAHSCSHPCVCCRPASGHTVRGVSETGPVINSVPIPRENGSAETTVAEGGRNLVAGLWGHTLGEN